MPQQPRAATVADVAATNSYLASLSKSGRRLSWIQAGSAAVVPTPRQARPPATVQSLPGSGPASLLAPRQSKKPTASAPQPTPQPAPLQPPQRQSLPAADANVLPSPAPSDEPSPAAISNPQDSPNLGASPSDTSVMDQQSSNTGAVPVSAAPMSSARLIPDPSLLPVSDGRVNNRQSLPRQDTHSPLIQQIQSPLIRTQSPLMRTQSSGATTSPAGASPVGAYFAPLQVTVPSNGRTTPNGVMPTVPRGESSSVPSPRPQPGVLQHPGAFQQPGALQQPGVLQQPGALYAQSAQPQAAQAAQASPAAQAAQPRNPPRNNLLPSESKQQLASRLDGHIASLKNAPNGIAVLDGQRLSLLKDTLKSGDGFFASIHQVFCLWSLRDYRQSVYGLFPNISASEIDRAMRVLEGVLRPNTHLSTRNLQFCAEWPVPPRSLLASQRLLRNIGVFLERLASHWELLQQRCHESGRPLLVSEMAAILGCISKVMQRILFTTIRRGIGVFDGPFSQKLDQMFAEDLRANTAMDGTLVQFAVSDWGDLEARDRLLCDRYQAIVNQARRDAHNRAAFAAQQQRPPVPTPASAPTPVPPSSAGLQTPAMFGLSPTMAGGWPGGHSGPNPAQAPTASIGTGPLAQVLAAPASLAHVQMQAGTQLGQYAPPNPAVFVGPSPFYQQQAVPQPSPAVMGALYNPQGVHSVPAQVRESQAPQQMPGPHQNQAFQYTVPPPVPPSLQTRQTMQTMQTRQTIQAMETALRQRQATGHAPNTMAQAYGPMVVTPATAGAGAGPHMQFPSQLIAPPSPDTAVAAASLSTALLEKPFFPRKGQAIQLPEYAHDHYSETSLKMGWHQSHLRSPTRTKRPRLELPTGQRFHQYMTEWIVPPQLIPPQTIVYEFPFNLSDRFVTRLSKQVPTSETGMFATPRCDYFEGSLRLRLRCCRVPADKDDKALSMSQAEWVVTDTSWPPSILITLTREPANVANDDANDANERCRERTVLTPRRAPHNGKDLPIELTQFVGVGDHTIKVCVPAAQAQDMPKGFQYALAVEIVETHSSKWIYDWLTTRRVQPRKMTLKIIRERLGPAGRTSDNNNNTSANNNSSSSNNNPSGDGGGDGRVDGVIGGVGGGGGDNNNDDDDVAILVKDLSIDLADPFMAKIFEVPARGRACTHLECFDLATWLQTRESKPHRKCPHGAAVSGSGSGSHGSNGGGGASRLCSCPEPGSEPSLPDKWRCPICNRDARPINIIIDGFLLHVRRKLASEGKLYAKTLLVSVDGSWRTVPAEKDDDGDGGDGGDSDTGMGGTNTGPTSTGGGDGAASSAEPERGRSLKRSVAGTPATFATPAPAPYQRAHPEVIEILDDDD